MPKTRVHGNQLTDRAVGNCLATGVYTDAGYNSQGLLLSEVDGVWRTGLESPLPANAGDIQYAAASQSDCTGVGDCTVIGQYNDVQAAQKRVQQKEVDLASEQALQAELRTAIEHAVVLSRGERISLRDLPPAVRGWSAPS